MKKFKDALEAYDVALKALPEKHPLIATLHGNKAAVYMMDKKCAPLACQLLCPSPGGAHARPDHLRVSALLTTVGPTLSATLICPARECSVATARMHLPTVVQRACECTWLSS